MYPKIPHMIAVRMCDVYVGKRKGERGRAAGGKIDGWQPGEAVWLADRCVKSERALEMERRGMCFFCWCGECAARVLQLRGRRVVGENVRWKRVYIIKCKQETEHRK